MECQKATISADTHSEYDAQSPIQLGQKLAQIEADATVRAYAHQKAVTRTRFLASNIEAEPILLAKERDQIEREAIRQAFLRMWRVPVYATPGAIILGIIWCWPAAVAWAMASGTVGFFMALED